MSKHNLSQKDSFSAEFSESVQAVILENVNKDAMIKATIEKELQDEITPIQSMKVSHVVEIQDKVRKLTTRSDATRQTIQVAGEGANKVQVYPSAMVHIGMDGEIDLDGKNDKLTVKLSNLQKVNGKSSISNLQGVKNASRLMKIQKASYDHRRDNKLLDDVSNFDFLVFEKDNMPESINIYYDGESRKIDETKALAMNVDDFGLIRIDFSDGAPVYHYGAAELYFIDVRGVTNLEIKDEVKTDDFDFFTVKI